MLTEVFMNGSLGQWMCLEGVGVCVCVEEKVSRFPLFFPLPSSFSSVPTPRRR